MKNLDFSNLGLAPLLARGTGTVYALTAVAAAIAMGTTSPNIKLPEKGRYKITAGARVQAAAATFAASRTITLSVQRTNNTAAALVTTTAGTPVITTATQTLGDLLTPPIFVDTLNEDDALSLYIDVSVLPSAGAVNVTDCWILAEKLP